MQFPVDHSYAKSSRVQFIAIIIFILIALYTSVRLDLVEFSVFVQSIAISLVAMLVLHFVTKHELPAYSIDGDRFRFSPSGSYPIDQIYRIHIKKTKSSAFRLTVLAHDFARHRSPPLLNGDKLARDLQSMNAEIELIDDSDDA